jgi:hypothetical protein
VKIIRNFIAEIHKFSKTNWWVYIIYAALLLGIFLTKPSDVPSVLIVTSLHFIADIFIMMMLSAYSAGQYKQGTYHQIASMLLFLSIKVYTGATGGGWHYLSADPIYILAAIKHYKVDVKHSDLKVVNTLSMSILSLLLVTAITLSFRKFSIPIYESVERCIQTMGIFLFAIALVTVSNERLRYQIAIAGLTCMVVGSAWELAFEIQQKKIVGLALSYFLLPLTVLVFYIKTWAIHRPVSGAV